MDSNKAVKSNFEFVKKKKCKTKIKLNSWSFNRDDVIAEVIMLACQDDREICGLHELCEGIDPWPELSAYWNAFDGKCAALEGLAQAWLNRWEDESGIYDHSYIWEEMCDLLKEVGPGLWD